MTSIKSNSTIAFRNLGRNPKRTMLALLSIALAQFFVLAVDGFMAGYEDSLRDLLTGPLVGHVQVHHPEYREKQSMDLLIDQAKETATDVRSNPDVTRVMPRIYAPSLAAKSEEGFTSVVVGVELDSELEKGGMLEDASTTLSSGKFSFTAHPKKQTGDGPVASYGAIVGSALAKRQNLDVGDQLALIGQRADGSMAADLVSVEGVAKSSIALINGNGILISLSAAQEIFGMENQAHELTVRGVNALDSTQLTQSLKELRR